MLHRHRAHLLGKGVGVAVRVRTVGDTAADEDRSILRAVTGAAGALLAIKLLGRDGHIIAVLRRVRAGLPLRELVADHALQDIAADFGDAENGVVEFDLAGLLRIKLDDGEFHQPCPSLVRSFAGVGRSFGAFAFTASRTSTQLLSGPGTAPLIRMRPRSASVRTTSRFWVVTRSTPKWPAIFLPLNTRPGSWRWPVEPCERWDTETPWLASRPPKFQRFITPAKPLPWVRPEMSTFWP